MASLGPWDSERTYNPRGLLHNLRYRTAWCPLRTTHSVYAADQFNEGGCKTWRSLANPNGLLVLTTERVLVYRVPGPRQYYIVSSADGWA